MVNSVTFVSVCSWTDVVAVDQPVGTGFSVGGDTPAVNNAGDTTAFVLWLTNFFNLFPAYKSKKIHILSESYGGIYVRLPFRGLLLVLTSSRLPTSRMRSASRKAHWASS
jgi:hypothetical protein